MISSNEYRDRMARLRPNVYQQGKVMDRFDPSIVGGTQCHCGHIRFRR